MVRITQDLLVQGTVEVVLVLQFENYLPLILVSLLDFINANTSISHQLLYVYLLANNDAVHDLPEGWEVFIVALVHNEDAPSG